MNWTRIKETGCSLDLQYRKGPRKESWRVRFTPAHGPLRGQRQIIILRKKDGKGFRDWKEAHKFAANEIGRVNFGLTEQEKRVLKNKSSVELVRAEWQVEDLIESKKKKAPGTYQDIRYYCRTYIIPYFNAHCPYAADFTQDHWDGENPKIISFLAWFHETFPGYSPFNVKKYFGMVHKSFMGAGLLKRPVKISLNKKRVSPGKRITPDQVHSLLSAAMDLRKPYNRLMHLTILMAIHQGMRRTEITSLQWNRIDLERGEIALRAEDTKIRKAREFALSSQVRFILKGMQPEAKSAFVFPNRDDHSRPMTSFKTAWKKTRDKAGVECRFHDLRHTFLSEALLTHKKDPLKVAVFAGVSLDVIETVYLHPRADDTREVVEAISDQFSTRGTG